MTTIIRLSNGDEIIGTISLHVNGTTTINDPLLIEEKEVQPGLFGIVLNRYDFFTHSHDITINDSLIVYERMASNAMTEYYRLSLEYIKKRVDHMINTSIQKAIDGMKMMDQEPPTDGRVMDDDDNEDSEEWDYNPHPGNKTIN